MAKRIFSILLAIVALSSCQKINDPHLANVSILGHGGMGHASQYPMNTLESISSALALGVDGLEVDVQLTKDSVLIAYHDEQLQLNTNSSGWVSERSWEEISKTYFTDYPHAKYRIRTLNEIADAIKRYPRAIINLDLKQLGPGIDTAYKMRFIRKLNEFANESQLEDKLVLSTADTVLVTLLNAANPQLNILLYVNEMAVARQFSKPELVDGVLIRNANLSTADAYEVVNSDWSLWVWAVRDKQDLQNALKKKVNFVIADNVRSVMKSMETKGQD